MNRMGKRLAASAGATGSLVLGAFLSAGIVQAVTLIPPSMEVNLTPGSETNVTIKVFNETDGTLELYPEAVNFTAKGETGIPDFSFDTEKVGLSAWMELPKGPIVLKPNERVPVAIRLNPPTNADPGGHFATAFFSSSPPSNGQVKIATKVGTLILATVAGEVRERGGIASFKTTDDKKLFNHLPITFSARFENTGNVHLRPIGSMTVTNLFKKTVGTVEFNSGKGATLPGTTRKYDLTWEKEAVVELSGNIWKKFWQGYRNEKMNFAFGPHRATLDLKAGAPGAVSDSATVSFWVLPWHILLVWVIVAAVALVLLILLLKKYNTWIINKARQK